MARITRIRPRIRPYFPFSEPRFSGQYPWRTRGTTATANSGAYLGPATTPVLLRSALSRKPLNLYEDRRFYHPEGIFAWPQSLVSKVPRVDETDFERWKRISKPKRRLNWAEESRKSLVRARIRIGWDNPWKMIICLKRKVRREVMHAMGLAGASRFKKPRWTQFSYVRCW